MPMYNLLEYSKNYRKRTGSLWNYKRDEPSNPLSSNSEFFKYRTSIVGKTPQNNDSLMNTKVVIPLKHLSHFWRSLDIPFINFEVELILTWSKNWVLADMKANITPWGATFKITDKKLYVSVVTLSKWHKTFRTIKNRI